MMKRTGIRYVLSRVRSEAFLAVLTSITNLKFLQVFEQANISNHHLGHGAGLVYQTYGFISIAKCSQINICDLMEKFFDQIVSFFPSFSPKSFYLFAIKRQFI